jgi:hypothetical protein
VASPCFRPTSCTEVQCVPRGTPLPTVRRCRSPRWSEVESCGASVDADVQYGMARHASTPGCAVARHCSTWNVCAPCPREITERSNGEPRTAECRPRTDRHGGRCGRPRTRRPARNSPLRNVFHVEHVDTCGADQRARAACPTVRHGPPSSDDDAGDHVCGSSVVFHVKRGGPASRRGDGGSPTWGVATHRCAHRVWTQRRLRHVPRGTVRRSPASVLLRLFCTEQKVPTRASGTHVEHGSQAASQATPLRPIRGNGTVVVVTPCPTGTRHTLAGIRTVSRKDRAPISRSARPATGARRQRDLEPDHRPPVPGA